MVRWTGPFDRWHDDATADDAADEDVADAIDNDDADDDAVDNDDADPNAAATETTATTADAETATPPDPQGDATPATDADAEQLTDAESETDANAPRTYLRIQPADDGVAPERAHTNGRRLHRLEGDDDRPLWRRLLPGSPPPPTIEILLVSTGGPDPTVTYYVGIDDPGTLDVLERTLRGLFPDTYEFDRTQFHPREVWTDANRPTTTPDEPSAASDDTLPTTDDTTATSDDDPPTTSGTTDPPTPQSDDPPPVAAVTFEGVPERRQDWQTQLRSFGKSGTTATDHTTTTTSDTRVPLATVVETMAETRVPMVYQCLLRPKPDWSAAADARIDDIRHGTDTLLGTLLNELLLAEPGAADDVDLPRSERQRIDAIEARDHRWSFTVNARAIAVAVDDPVATASTTESKTTPAGDADPVIPADGTPTTNATATDRTSDTATDPTTPTTPSPTAVRAAELAVEELATAFATVSGATYEIDATVHTDADAAQVREAIATRRLHPPDYDRWRTRLPGTTTASEGIVADATEAPSFWLLDGAALTAAGERAVGPTPGERTSRPRPPTDRLDAYRGPGFTLGRPLTQDDTAAAQPVAVPPSLQPLHLGIFGPTGSGKSVLAATGLLETHAATDGATILLEPKGDGMATDYLRAHYERFGTLEDVYYVDCSELLPAFSFFDIRGLLEAGVARDTAVEKLTSHYMEILRQVVGRERFDSAIRSPVVIQYLVKALFDPANGQDAFRYRDLHAAARRMHERESPPTVSQPDLERALGGVVANRARTFDEIMQGVANRVEQLIVDRRLARVFNHVPRDDDDPHFDFGALLDEDVTILFDLGDLQGDARRVLTLVVLSQLWRALTRRQQAQSPDAAHPLVTLHVEEAASIAASELLNTLLSQGRAFDLAVSLSMQFPAQLRERAPETYRELLANVGSFVVGPVPVDDRLATRLATDDMPPGDVATRLRALERGEWLVSLPGAYNEPAPRPFRVESLAPPAGHSASDDSLSAAAPERAEAAIDMARARTKRAVGLALGEPGVTTDPTDDGAPNAGTGSADDAAGDAETAMADGVVARVDSTLPHTNRMPRPVEYDAAFHGLRCRECDNRYDPAIEGMKRAIRCCHDLAAVDRDDVPVCELNLKLAPAERAATEWTDTQLMFLQSVYNAQQRRYDPLEYDITRDSMVRLREYVDIDTDAVADLIDAGLLQHDTNHPHKLYSVTPDGRNVIGESYREGVDYGHGEGDLDESSEHVLGIELGERLLAQGYVGDPDSPAAAVVPYYELDDGRRLDVAAVDDDGDVVVAVEVERINHDFRRAVPDDFDKLAACEPAEAIWIVMGRPAGHQVVQALHDPPDGDPRVEKSYSENTPPQQFQIDTAGLTAVYPIRYVKETLLADRDG